MSGAGGPRGLHAAVTLDDGSKWTFAHALDVTKPASVERFLAAAIAANGPIETIEYTPNVDYTDDVFEAVAGEAREVGHDGVTRLGQAVEQRRFADVGNPHDHHTNITVGTPWNPWDRKVHRIPGGSSSGAGVAVGGGLVPDRKSVV